MKNIFVPFTLDKTFWDLNKEMVFLDEVYLSNLDSDFLKRVNYTALPHEECKLEYMDLVSFSQSVINCLVPFLNEHHNTDFSITYWEKLLTGWMKRFIFDIYYKSMELEKLFEKYPDVLISTHLRQEDKDYILALHRTCGDNYIEKFYHEEYNFHIYSSLIKNSFRRDQFDISVLDTTSKLVSHDCFESKKRIKRVPWRLKDICGIGEKILCRYYLLKEEKGAKVLYYLTSFTPEIRQRLVLESKGKIQFAEVLPAVSKGEIHFDDRNKLKEFLKNSMQIEDGWKKMALLLLADEIPMAYLEQYHELKVRAEAFLHKYPKLNLMLTSVGFLNNRAETFAAVQMQQLGVRLAGMQHGGNYGLINLVGNDEFFIEDSFYGWGEWIKDVAVDQKEFSIGPTCKMKNYESKSNKNTIEYVLYGGTAIFAHQNMSEYTGLMHGKEYCARQIAFFFNLSEKVRQSIVVRNFYREYGWNINEKLRNIFPNLKFEVAFQRNKTKKSYMDARDEGFSQALKHCKLYICDHISTTWLEALYINKPFFLLIKRGHYKFRKAEEKYIAMLEEVGIIQYDLSAAASLVSDISFNVDMWWENAERKKVLNIIRKRYLQQDRDLNIGAWWVSELMKYV